MKIWRCKIGEVDETLLSDEADFPMRKAIKEVYERLTGQEPNFIFSGWGAELTESERVVANGCKH
jgi:hypothetical protein